MKLPQRARAKPPRSTPLLDYRRPQCPSEADKESAANTGQLLRRSPRRIALLAGLALACLAVPLIISPAPRFIWNASASMPVGLYRVHPDAPIEPDDLVIAWTPQPWRLVAARRHYLPLNVPLVKRVAAVEHDLVCAEGEQVSVNGSIIAERLERDGHSRLMPWWEGCLELIKGETFLLGSDDPGSFDGRYFGVTGPKELVGKAELIWAR